VVSQLEALERGKKKLAWKGLKLRKTPSHQRDKESKAFVNGNKKELSKGRTGRWLTRASERCQSSSRPGQKNKRERTLGHGAFRLEGNIIEKGLGAAGGEGGTYGASRTGAEKKSGKDANFAGLDEKLRLLSGLGRKETLRRALTDAEGQKYLCGLNKTFVKKSGSSRTVKPSQHFLCRETEGVRPRR